MLPKTLALIDDDADFTEAFAPFLRQQGVDVSVFADSSDLLASESPFAYEFYVVDLMLPGVEGGELIRILRRRTDAGVLVVSGKVGASVFEAVIDAGADMYLEKPISVEQAKARQKLWTPGQEGKQQGSGSGQLWTPGS